MKKHILAVLLATMLSGTTLTACQDTTAAETTGTEASLNTDAGETVPPETEEYVAPAVKYDGRDFIFCAWKTDNPNWVATSYFEAGAGEQNGDPIDESLYYRNLQVEESLGVKIVAKDYSSSKDMIAPTLAGDHYADTVLPGGDAISSIVNQKLTIDLKTIQTLDLTKSWWDQYANAELSIGGKQYFATGGISSFSDLAVFTTFFNKNMIKDYSLDDPYQLVRDGKWTLDRMAEMATAVAADLNGDGKMDENDRFGMSSEALGVVTMLSTGTRITEKDENDMPRLALSSERAANVVETFVPLYRNKEITLYTGDFQSQYGHVFSQFLTPMFLSDQLLFINNWMCIALEMRTMESDFGILPPAKYEEAQDRYYVPSSESWMYYAVVPVTEPDLDFTGHVMDALGYFGKKEVHTAIIEKTITDKTARDTETEEMLHLIYDNRCYDLASLFDWGGVTGMLNQFINNKNTGFASAMASKETAIVSAMEKTVEDFTE